MRVAKCLCCFTTPPPSPALELDLLGKQEVLHGSCVLLALLMANIYLFLYGSMLGLSDKLHSFRDQRTIQMRDRHTEETLEV